MKKSGVKLLLDGHRGIYIPRDFCKEINLNKFSGLDPDDAECCLAGPDEEWYWESWTNIMNHALHIDEDGDEWFLYQDDDLFLMCEALMTKEEKESFGFETDDDEEEEPHTCDQCNLCTINGVVCHEQGCPNTEVECRECGSSMPRSQGRYCPDCQEVE